MVDNNELKGLNQGTLGIGDHATIGILQNLFNTFGRVTLGDREWKYESTRKYYEPNTPIDCIFDQIYERKIYPVAANVTYADIKMVSFG